MFWAVMVIGFILICAALYTIIPDLFLHRLGFGSWKRQYSPGVALTFDDGPDPMITPRLLEVLKRRKLSVTFFVIAEKAAKYPELIRQMVKEGHQIGVHSLSHHYAWFTSPWKTAREWTESVRILEQLMDKKITWMRPPWGTFNLVTWLWLKRHNMRAVLWNAEGHDWEARRSPEDINARILKKVNEGSIVVLHDSGGESGAPENTLRALELIADKIPQQLKLPFVPLEFPDWSLGRRLTFRLWEKWEHHYAKQHHVERVDDTNIFRLEKTIYEGPELYSEEGTLLAQKGDTVAEIHIDNIRLQAKGRDAQKTALKAMRKALISFPDLARYIANNPGYSNIKVFIGETLLYRGVKGFGFTVQDLPDTWKSKGIAWLQRTIMLIYHPEGKERQNGRLGNKTKLVWISREKLLSYAASGITFGNKAVNEGQTLHSKTNG
ncbi:putative xylanase/chitin deacetylase [Desulfosporosinus acidiphilus SJ4]|uniref:Putative xylanase/chitin deacetylase n=1 Tax=Desulfosporosinus acidiphilus (strain DSM 22704 / JCM 16185 / SJ4) TaxID=646529 RepID=I4DBL3_DESAJ|nr:polysaccharide deacetylase family protein [Desulfosporosinus acidiphilus]AFM43187.1 putative xylanase/chitin deacetylase [Desulfosporosinus acidiphilus SJ4]